MITIKAEGFDDLLRGLDGMKRQIPYALANGINAVARKVKEAEQQTMQQVFDAPTPFTLKSLRMTPAKAPRTIQASVWFKDPPNLGQKDHYLLPQVEGGPRPMKPFEMGMGGKGYVMPGKGLTKGNGLDRYGNLGRGQITKLLSRTRGFSESGFKANTPSWNKNAKDMVVVKQKRGKLLPGVYERVNSDEAGGRAGRYLIARSLAKKKGSGTSLSELNTRYRKMYPQGLRPLVIFTKKTPTYRPRFDFYGVANRVIDSNLHTDVQAAVADEIQREWDYRARKGTI